MPTLTAKPMIEPWTHPPETTAALDWAPLAVIDLSKYDESGGKQILAKELEGAVKQWGFWVVVGTGIPQEQIDRQFAIGNAFFKMSLEEKRKMACDFKDGNNFGYREASRLVGKTNIKENVEMLNIPKFTSDYTPVPQHDLIKAFHDEIGPFHRLVWEKVIKRLFVLFAIILELPENWFVERHEYERPSEDHIRFLLYHPRPLEDDEMAGSNWILGHTDFGSLTTLFSQNVAALQIRTPDDQWKWVKPVKGGLTCNAADTLSFLTKGYIKSTVHRVVRPPPDQANLERLALGYFARPGNDVPLIPAPSPVLKREGYLTKEDENLDPKDAVTGYEYVRARTKDVNDRKSSRVAERSPDAMFKVKNLAVKDYYL